MGAQQSIARVNFEDVQYAIDNDEYVLVNTLPSGKQGCLIQGTIHADDETLKLNKLLRENVTTKIVVYGENANDPRVETKCHQLRSLGFIYVYLYGGGLFEWLLLQDVYGDDMFKTTTKESDHLRYRGAQQLGVRRIKNV